jgi:hypothetical protein
MCGGKRGEEQEKTIFFEHLVTMYKYQEPEQQEEKG